MISLDQIAIRHGTDKSSKHHGYCEVYEHYFSNLRNEAIVLIEIGFGGYHYPDRGGAGAKTWAEYFPKGQIATIDINEKNKPKEERIHFFKGSQTDGDFLLQVISVLERPDIVIDDGSHFSHDVIKAFEILFPYLWPGGIYVIEDTHASYWTDHGFGGGWHENTTMNYFKRLADNLNYENNGLENKGIKAIHFWKQQIFVLKA